MLPFTQNTVIKLIIGAGKLVIHCWPIVVFALALVVEPLGGKDIVLLLFIVENIGV